VGGLCRTLSYRGRSFDLGANYVTPAYTEIRRLARRLGARLYTERPFVAMAVPADPEQEVTFQSIFQAMRRDATTGRRIPLLRFLWANLKFTWLRFRLRGAIDAPSFAGLEEQPDLMRTFGEWLDAHGIGCLRTVFQLPVNLMGYGTVETTPAPYPLKFMKLSTFVPMVLKEAPGIGRFMPWPKRFTDGYQRFFERLSWGLDVRLGIDVLGIERKDGRVLVRYRQPEQVLNEVRMVEGELEADRLVLACPLSPDVLGRFLELSDRERELFSRIQTLSYCMTTHEVEGLEFGGESPLAACFPVPPIGTPWGVAKQWKDNAFTQFYTRVESSDPHDDVQAEVERGIEVLVRQMGGRILPRRREWPTYDRWPYFQHVDVAAFREGWYTRLEALQGEEHTYYVGGATNFELIEPIAEYARHLVATHFPPRDRAAA
jgi:hypothetical protein